MSSEELNILIILEVEDNHFIHCYSSGKRIHLGLTTRVNKTWKSSPIKYNIFEPSGKTTTETAIYNYWRLFISTKKDQI